MTQKEYKWPNCWIRGYMHSADYQNDPVRLAVINCPHRVEDPSSFVALDYKCHHPAIRTKEEVEGPKKAYGGIVAGGLSDDYATFCKAVDMHLTSLGEPSRLALEAEYRVLDEPKLLPEGQILLLPEPGTNL